MSLRKIVEMCRQPNHWIKTKISSKVGKRNLTPIFFSIIALMYQRNRNDLNTSNTCGIPSARMRNYLLFRYHPRAEPRSPGIIIFLFLPILSNAPGSEWNGFVEVREITDGWAPTWKWENGRVINGRLSISD